VIALANILLGIGIVLKMALTVVMWLVIIRAVISWVNPDPFNPIVRFLIASTDPLLTPLRRFFPPVGPGIDLSPLILIALIIFLQIALAGTIIETAQALKSPVPS